MLILASQSPRRKALLKTLGIPFRVVASHASERSRERHPVLLVKQLALRKARAVARRVHRGWVLGADTVVVAGGEILGKPRDVQDARRILSCLSGTVHRVYTGVALVDAERGRKRVEVAVSRVRMRHLPEEALRRLSKKHLDKSGAYAIQGEKDGFARVVSGPYDNVMGLPLAVVKRLLEQFRVSSCEFRVKTRNPKPKTRNYVFSRTRPSR